ncbi:hypothetical protein BW47_03975 [Thermosipho melanesiensis]|uniref:Secreted protein n=1 Tax=Thermosipho melanesiensis TaxID=46541 RepID=A0ABM6GGN1_9BACT|nr:hypothetical protein BW47_03975 [Thermosipho melanesiensis]
MLHLLRWLPLNVIVTKFIILHELVNIAIPKSPPAFTAKMFKINIATDITACDKEDKIPTFKIFFKFLNHI